MFISENELSLELLGIFKLERAESTTKANMQRNYDSLSVRLAGSGEFKCDGQTVSVKRGDLLYIPKNARYSQKTVGETIIAIHFMNYTYDYSSQIEKLTANRPDYVEQLVRKMYDAWKEKNQGYRYRCTALLYELLYEANCQSVEGQREQDAVGSRINQAANYIHRNFRRQQMEVSELARMCGVSQVYFRKLFKLRYGTSPKQYINALRLETAAQLLQSQLYSVSEVSEKSGFTDPKYFTKLFTKRFDCGPKRYQHIVPEKNWK